MDIFGVSVPLWVILLIVLFIIWYRRATAQFGFFKDQGIPGIRPFPVVGSAWSLFTSGLAFRDYDKYIYHKFGKPSCTGSFVQGKPMLLVFDKDLLKRIMVKDFNLFTNRNILGVQEYPFKKMVTLLEDDEWRHIRSHLSPTFSGKKMRQMVLLINQCCKNLITSLKVCAKSGDNLECSEYTSAFSMDVISSVAFGLDVDCQNDKNNIFIRMAAELTIRNIRWSNPAVLALFFMPSALPFLGKLGFKPFKQEAVDFFVDLTERAIKDREGNPENLPADFLQMLITSKKDEDLTNEDQVKKNTRGGLTTEEILAQCLVFFSAGLSTVSMTLAAVLYHLAVYPDVQEKAYREVMDVMADKDPDYDDIKNMNYIRMCIDETLRLYPPAPRVDRVCKEDVELNGIKLKKGMLVGVPVGALHLDDEAWPEPEKFDPERFTPEAKEDRHPYQFLPFGGGPRSCVAQRLAIMETKMAIAHIVKNYKLLTCEKTEIPPTLKLLQAEPKKGTWIKIEART